MRNHPLVFYSFPDLIYNLHFKKSKKVKSRVYFILQSVTTIYLSNIVILGKEKEREYHGT